MRQRLWILLWLLMLCSVAGLAGQHWWLLDLANHFRLQYVGAGFVLLLLACVLRDRRNMALGIVVGWLCLGLWASPFRLPWATVAQIPGTPLTVVTANLLIGNPDLSALSTWLRTVQPDVLVVEELDADGVRMLDQVDPALRRVWALPENQGAFGLGVWSRLPVGVPEPRELGPYRLASVRVPLLIEGGIPVQLYATHPFPPIGADGSAARNVQFEQLVQWLAEHPGPALLAGDLNATPWSRPLQALADSARLHDGSHRHLPVPTWRPLRLGVFAGLLALPIDHVLLRGGQVRQLQRGPAFGSDHRPLLARVVFAQPAGLEAAAVRMAATTADSKAPAPAARH